MSTLTVKELAAPTGYDIKLASGETLDLNSQGSVIMPTGSVLQVKQTVKSDAWSSSSQSWVDISGLSVTITPSNVNNKIMVMPSLSVYGNGTSHVSFRLVRDTTPIMIGDASGVKTQTTFQHYTHDNGEWYSAHSHNTTYIDSPSSTSVVTYKMQYANPHSSGYSSGLNKNVYNTADVSWSGLTASSITVMEIAG